MTTDQLDVLGHRAAEQLRSSLDDLDTEAALAELVLDGQQVPATLRTRTGERRRMGVSLAVAAVVLAIVGVAAVTVISGSDDTRVGTGAKPVLDPSDYGPRIGRLVSQQDPSLIAEVHGPAPLGAADAVAVSIQGGRPDHTYAMQLCRREGLPVNNPATSCTWLGTAMVAPDGTAVEVVRLPAVYMGAVPVRQNDCREVACDLVVEAVIDDDEPDAGVPGTRFVDMTDPWYQAEGPEAPPSPWIALSFDPDADVGPLPSMELVAAGEGRDAVRVAGTGLAPGELVLAVHGFEREPVGPFGEIASVAVVPLATVAVDADGTFTVDVDLPEEVVDDGDGERVATVEGGTPVRVDCSAAQWACQVRATWVDGPPIVGGVPALLPEPVAYPAG